MPLQKSDASVNSAKPRAKYISRDVEAGSRLVLVEQLDRLIRVGSHAVERAKLRVDGSVVQLRSTADRSPGSATNVELVAHSSTNRPPNIQVLSPSAVAVRKRASAPLRTAVAPAADCDRRRIDDVGIDGLEEVRLHRVARGQAARRSPARAPSRPLGHLSIEVSYSSVVEGSEAEVQAELENRRRGERLEFARRVAAPGGREVALRIAAAIRSSTSCRLRAENTRLALRARSAAVDLSRQFQRRRELAPLHERARLEVAVERLFRSDRSPRRPSPVPRASAAGLKRPLQFGRVQRMRSVWLYYVLPPRQSNKL